MLIGGSLAFETLSLLGMPEKGMPNALMNAATARALVRARPRIATTDVKDTTFIAPIPPKRAMKVSHSLTNPFSGGSAAIDAAPMRKSKEVIGMRFVRPPSSSIFDVPVEYITDPAPVNKRFLNSE